MIIFQQSRFSLQFYSWSLLSNKLQPLSSLEFAYLYKPFICRDLQDYMDIRFLPDFHQIYDGLSWMLREAIWGLISMIYNKENCRSRTAFQSFIFWLEIWSIPFHYAFGEDTYLGHLIELGFSMTHLMEVFAFWTCSSTWICSCFQAWVVTASLLFLCKQCDETVFPWSLLICYFRSCMICQYYYSFWLFIKAYFEWLRHLFEKTLIFLSFECD